MSWRSGYSLLQESGIIRSVNDLIEIHNCSRTVHLVDIKRDLAAAYFNGTRFAAIDKHTYEYKDLDKLNQGDKLRTMEIRRVHQHQLTTRDHLPLSPLTSDLTFRALPSPQPPEDPPNQNLGSQPAPGLSTTPQPSASPSAALSPTVTKLGSTAAAVPRVSAPLRLAPGQKEPAKKPLQDSPSFKAKPLTSLKQLTPIHFHPPISIRCHPLRSCLCAALGWSALYGQG